MNGALRSRLRLRHRRALSPASRRRPRADGRPNRGMTARRPSLPTAWPGRRLVMRRRVGPMFAASAFRPQVQPTG
eukprot:2482070-Alexandrium_andersonii.AAC.1